MGWTEGLKFSLLERERGAVGKKQGDAVKGRAMLELPGGQGFAWSPCVSPALNPCEMGEGLAALRVCALWVVHTSVTREVLLFFLIF